MEHLDLLKQFGVTSLDDARKLAEFTDHIVTNLKFIEGSNVNFNEMAEHTSAIVTNLKVIEEQA